MGDTRLDAQSSVGLNRLSELLADVKRNPWKLRHLRKEINELAGAPARSRIGHMLMHFDKVAANADRGAPAILEEILDMERLATVSEIGQRTKIEHLAPHYLTTEKPAAIADRQISDPYSKPVFGYTSVDGVYVVSFCHDIPVMFDVGYGNPKVIVDQSSPNYDAIYGFDVQDYSAKPDFSCGLLAVIYDEFLGNNYCHWLLDWLPRFYYLSEMEVEISQITILLSRKAAPYQRDTLRILGVEDRQCIEVLDTKSFRSSSVAAKQFIGTSTTNSSFNHAMHGGTSILAQYLRNVFVPRASSERIPKLILQRRGTRKLIISEACDSALQAVGFVTVYLEDFAFIEQVGLFAGARCIISAHGAGLANLVFCRPGAAVLEIFPTGYSTAAYWITASVAELKYSCAVAPIWSSKPVSHVRDSDLIVSDTVITAWLSSL